MRVRRVLALPVYSVHPVLNVLPVVLRPVLDSESTPHHLEEQREQLKEAVPESCRLLLPIQHRPLPKKMDRQLDRPPRGDATLDRDARRRLLWLLVRSFAVPVISVVSLDGPLRLVVLPLRLLVVAQYFVDAIAEDVPDDVQQLQ